jgi:TctA family transporter
MQSSRLLLFLLTLLLLVISIYVTWVTGKIYGLVSIVAFALLLPYEYSKAFPAAKPKPGKH